MSRSTARDAALGRGALAAGACGSGHTAKGREAGSDVLLATGEVGQARVEELRRLPVPSGTESQLWEIKTPLLFGMQGAV